MFLITVFYMVSFWMRWYHTIVNRDIQKFHVLNWEFFLPGGLHHSVLIHFYTPLLPRARIIAEVLPQNRERWRFAADLLRLTEQSLSLPFKMDRSQMRILSPTDTIHAILYYLSKVQECKLLSLPICRLVLSCITRQAACWLNLAFLRGNIFKGKLSFWWEWCLGVLLEPLCRLQLINKL